MSNHPIEGLMTTAMQSIKEMIDVNTIVGDAVQAPDGTVIIPISKVSFGFAAGGGDYTSEKRIVARKKKRAIREKMNIAKMNKNSYSDQKGEMKKSRFFGV